MNYIYTSEQIDCIKKMIIEKIFVGILEYPECNKNYVNICYQLNMKVK